MNCLNENVTLSSPLKVFLYRMVVIIFSNVTHKPKQMPNKSDLLTFPMSHQTHSLSQRRAVPGRRKRFDTLLAEHKNRARERERERELHQPHSQQNPSLRDPHPSTHLAAAHDAYQVTHGNGPAPDATKPLPLSKPKFHSPGLPRYVPFQFFIYFCMYVLTPDKLAFITER